MNRSLKLNLNSTPIDQNMFNNDNFNKTGLFIVRNFYSPSEITSFQNQFELYFNDKLNNRNLDKANSVNVKFPEDNNLNAIYKNDKFKKLAMAIYGNNVAIFNKRYVIKDHNNPEPVMLHQDSCYHMGFLNKSSVFVPLTEVNEENGGMYFYLGTHQYGYLGDAGEIDLSSFENDHIFYQPSLEPGDILVMNSSIWHGSSSSKNGKKRILCDIIIQDSSDPTGEELLCGKWNVDFRLNKNNLTSYFKNSRILKLKKAGY